MGAGKRDAGIQGDHSTSASLGNHTEMGRESCGDAEFECMLQSPTLSGSSLMNF